MAGIGYADASALVKLVLAEPESHALDARVGALDHLVTSDLAEVEVAIAARRVMGAGGARAAENLLGELDTIPVDAQVRRIAARFDPPTLRSLDAIHLASALSVRDVVDVFLCYDRRLGEAAAAAGLVVESPGVAG